MHTKVDENEDGLQLTKSQHIKDLQRLEEEKVSKVKEWEEEKTLVTILRTQLASLEAEREELTKKQVKQLTVFSEGMI